jgi:sodium transport system permease protein
MNPRDIWILYRRELRSALRERSIVANSILIPILLYPLLIWLAYTGMTFVSGQTDSLESRVMLTDLPSEHRGIRQQLEAIPEIQLLESKDPKTDLQSGNLDVWVEFLPVDKSFKVRLTYDESRDQSSQGRERVSKVISNYRGDFLKAEALRLGLSPEQFQDVWLEEMNVSTKQEMGRFVLGLLLPMVLIIMLAVGGIHPAIDTTAGERENSTWETLMTLATSRANILVSKYLYVATMSFVAGVLNVIAMTISMRSLFAPGIGEAATLSFEIPLTSIPVLVLGAALLSLFLSAGMMIMASFARTFKEGQSMVSPFYIAIILPITFMQGPMQAFTTKTALIPVVNVAMMFREAIVGSFDWRLIAITTAVEATAVILALRLSLSILNYEDFVMGSYGGSFGKFLKERFLKK